MLAAERQAVVEALRRPRYEVLPLPGVAELVAALLPPAVTVTVTASPARGTARTLEVVEELAAHGRTVVPHLAARQVRDRVELRDVLQRLRGCGVSDVFVVAGDAREPAGVFDGALDLLAAMAEIGPRPDQVGITGYPERHPFIDDDVTIQAMWDKRRYATYIVSQLCFRPRVVAAWVRRVRRRGVDLPVHLGVPGPVDMARLLRIGARVGVGSSARFARRHAGWLPHLLAAGGYRPGRLVDGLAATLADPALRVAGLHLYTFNELAGAERWRRRALARYEPATWSEPGRS